MAKRMMVALSVFLLLVLGMASAQDVNLLTNPSFEELDAQGYPVGWSTDMYNTAQGISELEVLQTGASDGTNHAVVRNNADNDARFSQTVSVEPNTYYRISGDVWCVGSYSGAKGANLSVEGVYETSVDVHDTANWQRIELTGKTGNKQKQLTVWCRLGGYGMDNMGEAHFDNMVLEKLEEEPAYFVDFEAPPLQVQPDEGQGTVQDTTSLMPTLLMGCFIYVVLFFFAYYWVCRDNKKLKGFGVKTGFALLLILGFFVRVFFAMTTGGHETDINDFKIWAMQMYEVGPWGFYAQGGFSDYPPGYMLVLWPLGALQSWLGLEYDGAIFNLLVKMPAILCDLGAAYLLFALGRKMKIGDLAAAALGACILFNPAAIHNASVWAQVDSVLTLLLMLCAYYVIDKRILLGSIWYSVALLVKPQALLVGPVLLFAYVLVYIKKEKTLKQLLSYIGICVAGFLLLCLPFWGGQEITWILSKYIGTVSNYAYGSVNAFNLFALLGYNWVDQSTTLLGIPLYVLGHGFLVLVLAYAAYLGVKSKELRIMPLLCAIIVMGMFTLEVRQHERYLFPVLFFLPMAFGFYRDRRFLWITLIVSLMQFINNGIVLEVIHVTQDKGSLYTVMRMCSMINVVTFAYLCYVSHQVVVKKQIQGIQEARPMKAAQEHIPVKLPALFKDGNEQELRMVKKDWLVMAVLTAVYSVVAFVNLGTTQAPETYWVSSSTEEAIIFDLGEPRPIERLYYDVGICSGTFEAEISLDGQNYEFYNPRLIIDEKTKEIQKEVNPIAVGENTMFRWQVAHCQEPELARYIRIMPKSVGLVFLEIGFSGHDGERYPVVGVTEDPSMPVNPKGGDIAALWDEQETIPKTPSYYNGTYFDEIYHARTAYEQVHHMPWYETTHPPLGKVFISFGIMLFGMNPFGWRIAGTLAGIFMLPALYVLLKRLFKRTDLCALGTFIFAFDFMHFTQTRIATIDSFGVLFIILMYLFMIIYMQRSFNRQPLKKTLVPLFWSGLFMGCGIASKWIDIYAAAGLAILFFITIGKRFVEFCQASAYLKASDQKKDRVAKAKDTQTVNLPFQIAGVAALVLIGGLMGMNSGIPGMVSILFYAVAGVGLIWILGRWFISYCVDKVEPLNLSELTEEQVDHARKVRDTFVKNMLITLGACVVFFVVIPIAIYIASYTQYFMIADKNYTLTDIWEAQKSMLSYHSQLVDDHSFKSPWWEWPIIRKPMFYFMGDFLPRGTVSAISAFGNPAVWWLGIGTMLLLVWRWVRGEGRKDPRMLWVIIGFCAQFMPWVLVPRSTFIYHYFASIPFVVISILMLFEIGLEKWKPTRKMMIVYAGLVLGLFILFYPLLSGAVVPESYAQALRWMDSWVLFGSPSHPLSLFM